MTTGSNAGAGLRGRFGSGRKENRKTTIPGRKNLATAQARLDAALQAAATSPAKVSAADPDSRLLPAKNGGGWLQGWNLQLMAARRQILLAAELYDNPADAGALAEMITTAAANCELAGLAERIRGWLADNGYASTANLKALDRRMLLVAVSREAAQTGRADGPGGELPLGREKMAARLATPAWQETVQAPHRPRRARLHPALRPVRPPPHLPRPRRRRPSVAYSQHEHGGDIHGDRRARNQRWLRSGRGVFRPCPGCEVGETLDVETWSRRCCQASSHRL